MSDESINQFKTLQSLKLEVNRFVDSIPDQPSTRDVHSLAEFILSSRNLVAITGAGISTPSGEYTF
jgi:hypothetical protein